MLRIGTSVLACLVIAGLAMAYLANAAPAVDEKAEGLAIGDKAPAWTDLPGTDGQNHSLSDLTEAKAVVVCFTCNRCPVAVGYEDRMIELQKNYADKGVKLIAINVNKGENLEAMKERADSKDFNFAYLYDESQESARNFGAVVTPHYFVLDGNGTVVYMGSFDDNQRNPTKSYLTDAVDAVLEGRAPSTQVTKQFGCRIGWK